MAESIKKNFAYKSILTVSNYLMNFITFPYVSRVLGVEKIGLVNFVDNTVNYFLLFATMGVGLLGVREIAAVKDNIEGRSKVYTNILGINLLFTAFTLVVYLLCISFITKLHQYEELFYIGTAKIIFTAFLAEWFFTGMENFRYITLRTIIIKSIYVVSVFLLIKDIEDYQLYFILTVGVVVINALINQSYIRKLVCLNWSKLQFNVYFKQNVVLGIYALMTSMYLTFNVMYLGFVSNNTEVGYYTTAFRLYTVVLGLFTAFTNVMLPRMTSLLANHAEKEFQELTNKSFSVMASFCIPLVSCSIILAPQIIYILSGAGYEGAILPMQIIMPAALAVGVAQVLAIQILIPLKKERLLLLASIIGGICSLIINISIVPSLKSIGSSLVLLSSEIIVTSIYLMFCLYKRLISIPIDVFFKSLFFSIPSAVICYLCVKWNNNPFFSVVLSVFIGGGCWAILHIVFKSYLWKILNRQKNG